jgi:hypothetical protein
MGKMGFSIKWRSLIMECISLASASIRINKRPTYVFHLSRGLRQSDPPLLFLFFIPIAGLKVVLKTATENHLFTWHKNGESAISQISLSHLQFADDTLLLSEKSWASNICKLLFGMSYACLMLCSLAS